MGWHSECSIFGPIACALISIRVVQAHLDIPAPRRQDSSSGYVAAWSDFRDRLSTAEIYFSFGAVRGHHALLHSICGDGLCSEDEAKAAMNGLGGCPADCPPITVCPGSDIYASGHDGEQAIDGGGSMTPPIFPLFDWFNELGSPQVCSSLSL